MDNPNTHNDKLIAQLLSAGDPACMKMIFDGRYAALCSYAMRYLSNFDDAEDVVQSVLISFWNNKKGTRFEGSVRAYLFGAVAKASLRNIRDNKRAYFVEIEIPSDNLLDEIFDATAQQIEKMTADLNKLIGELSQNQKKVLEDIIFYNKPYKQIAQEMGITVNTVKTHYSRALKQIRDNVNYGTTLLLFLAGRIFY